MVTNHGSLPPCLVAETIGCPLLPEKYLLLLANIGSCARASRHGDPVDKTRAARAHACPNSTARARIATTGTVSSKDTSLEAQVYEAVLTGNMNEVKDLRTTGASLEHTTNGETPLLLACSRSDGFDRAKHLVGLGANIQAIGAGGYPVHVAARGGHNRTLDMLVDNGASLLVVDGAGNTPLEVARAERHVSTIRLIENRICLFNGNMRLQLDAWLPILRGINSSVWVVLIPTKSNPLLLELLIYIDVLKVTPHIRLPLHHSRFHISKPESNTPVFVAQHKVTKRKFLLLGGIGEKTRWEEPQVESLMKACSTTVVVASYGIYNLTHTPIPLTPPHDLQHKPPIPAHPIPSQPVSTDSPPLHRPSARTEISQGEVPKSRVAPPPHPPFKWPNAHSDPEEDELQAALKESLKPEFVNAPSRPQPRPQPYYHPQLQPQPQPQHQPFFQHFPNSPFFCQTQPQSQPHCHPTSQSRVHTQNPLGGQKYHTPSAPPFISTGMGGTGTGAGGHGGGDSEQKCVICWENARDVACVPCGHVACCMRCLTDVFESQKKECPACCTELSALLKVYMA